MIGSSKYLISAYKFLCYFALTLLLAACGASVDEEGVEGADAQSETVIAGLASKGLIVNGIVTAYLTENEAGQMVRATTPFGNAVRSDETGKFSLTLPKNKPVSAIVLEITADQQTQMMCDVFDGCGNDELGNPVVFGDSLSLGSGFVMRAMLSNLNAGQINSLHITPLSHLAVAHAESIVGGLNPLNIAAAYDYIETIMGLESGALQFEPSDLTQLDQSTDINQSQLELALMSASFLALVNLPDWNSVDEVLNHAEQRMLSTGSLSSVNMGALPDVAMDELYFEAGEIAQGLISNVTEPEHVALLTSINDEVQAAYELLTNPPEEVDPVFITQQPSSITVDEHSPSDFMVVATGGGTLSYQWRKDGINIRGAVSASYSLSDTLESDSGIYDVIISNSVGSVSSLSALLSVNIEEPENNSDPIAVDDNAMTFEDIGVTINVLSNDSDVDGDSLIVTSATATNGTAQINSDSSVTYMPSQDFYGLATLVYVVADGQGGSASGTASINVTGLNDNPVANDDSAVLAEDSAVTVNVLANDFDVDGDSLRIESVGPSNGSIVIIGSTSLQYTPASNVSGVEQVSYTLTDDQGGSATAFLNLTVNAVNDDPVAVDDSATLNEDSALNIDVVSNDSDIDGDTLVLSSASASNGNVLIVNSTTVSYVPNTNFNGLDSISYSISDGQGGSATASVSLTINAVNDDPIAIDDSATTDQDVATSIDVLLNDSDVDGDILTIVSVSAVNGSVSINGNGSLDYIPNNGYVGTETISYSVGDGQGGTANATVSLTVSAVVNVASIDLSWDIPSQRENGDTLELYEINGYMIAYGSTAGNLDSQVFVSGALVVNHVIENLSAGTYYFAIATVDSDGVQGAYSNTISSTIL